MEDSSFARETYKRLWLKSAEAYIIETQDEHFCPEFAPTNSEEWDALLKCFPGSCIKRFELNNYHVKPKPNIDTLSQVLVNSEIEFLDISDCNLMKEDLFQLMEVLKDSKLTELCITGNKFGAFSIDERDRFISLLQASHLSIFAFDFEDFYDSGLVPFFDALPDTKITWLNFSYDPNYDSLSPLLSNLPRCSLTELKLSKYEFNEDTLRSLSQAIRNSTLKKLCLSKNNVTDDGVDILVEGLIHSTITDLDLSENNIHGRNTLGLHLKDTCIEVLSFDDNCNNKLFTDFINGLKLSKVVDLRLANTDLTFPQVSKFAQILKDTNLKRVGLSANCFSRKSLLALAGGFKDSKLHDIDMSCCLRKVDPKKDIPLFLSKVKCSSVTKLKLCNNNLNGATVKTLAQQLKNSKITHLDLSKNPIGNGVISLAEHLKFSNLSHLTLKSCKITNKGVKALAKHLKETQLIGLDLDSNKITDDGTEALALSLKDSSLIDLSLYDNNIDDGIFTLAKEVENTFITCLTVPYQFTELVVWRNKLLVQRFINFFKCIAPEKGDNKFRFTSLSDNVCADKFLEDCLELYRDFIKRPSAISVLLENKSITLDREEINSLMLDEFPRQLSLLIAGSVDTDVKKHVHLLKKAEDWGLNKVVELLLSNRPLYVINRDEGVLDPYVYKLLNKYNYPIFNPDIEPEGKQKLITYFTEHSDMEYAYDVIRLLRGKRRTLFVISYD